MGTVPNHMIWLINNYIEDKRQQQQHHQQLWATTTTPSLTPNASGGFLFCSRQQWPLPHAKCKWRGLLLCSRWLWPWLPPPLLQTQVEGFPALFYIHEYNYCYPLTSNMSWGTHCFILDVYGHGYPSLAPNMSRGVSSLFYAITATITPNTSGGGS